MNMEKIDQQHFAPLENPKSTYLTFKLKWK